MTLSEKDFNKWWDSLTLFEKSETYLKMRSELKETDSIYSIPKWDTLVWNDGKFSVLDQSSCG